MPPVPPPAPGGVTDLRAAAGCRVVVVDGLTETAAVLRAVFEPRGHQVDRVRGFEFASRDATAAARVLVLHDDGPARGLLPGDARRVVIGRHATVAAPGERRLTHPFQYPELVRAIEALLADDLPRPVAA